MKSREEGFSLLEVMVAFTILSVSIGVLMQAFGGGTSLLSNAADQGRAVSLARSQMARVGHEWPLTEGEYSGQWQKYQWRVILEPYVPEEAVQILQRTRLLKATVMVTWEDRGRDRTYTLSTLRLAPSS